jgi:homoserine kinase type II
MASLVYLLWFVAKEDDEDDDGLLIGVYQTESAAKSAIERLRNKPGFVNYPEGFQIHTRELDSDSWSDGFIKTDV